MDAFTKSLTSDQVVSAVIGRSATCRPSETLMLRSMTRESIAAAFVTTRSLRYSRHVKAGRSLAGEVTP